MLTDAVQVATVSQTWSRAVFHIVAHSLDLWVMTCALGKTVWHEHVEHVGIGETHTLVATHLTLLQLILHLRLAEAECHRSWLCILQVHVDQQVVRRVETHKTIDYDTRIVCRNTLHIADTLSIDHQLYLWILHTHVPVCWFNAVNYDFFCCTHCQDICHQNGHYK